LEGKEGRKDSSWGNLRVRCLLFSLFSNACFSLVLKHKYGISMQKKAAVMRINKLIKSTHQFAPNYKLGTIIL
jgi:hypothetical protein